MTVDSAAKTIWDYMQLGQKPKLVDAIFVLGSSDTRLAYCDAELYAAGYAPLVILSGGIGRLTQDLFEESEADVFAKTLLGSVVPKNAIILENLSMQDLTDDERRQVLGNVLLDEPRAIREGISGLPTKTQFNQLKDKVDIIAEDVSTVKLAVKDQSLQLDAYGNRISALENA